MDETSYSDPEVIQLVNERFVAIRVETDQRPDVNRRYNMGGWRTTAFLTPDGELLTGGTYIPPQQMRGYLAQVSDAYKNDKNDILQRNSKVNAKRGAAQGVQAANDALSPQIVESILRAALDNFDTLYGGFNDEPTFPHTEALEHALEKYFRTGDESSLSVITITLTKMANGRRISQRTAARPHRGCNERCANARAALWRAESLLAGKARTSLRADARRRAAGATGLSDRRRAAGVHLRRRHVPAARR